MRLQDIIDRLEKIRSKMITKVAKDEIDIFIQELKDMERLSKQ